MIAPVQVTRAEYAPVHLSPRIAVSFSAGTSRIYADAYDHVERRALSIGEGRTADEALVDCKRKLRSLRTALDGADLEGA